jgi:hypothetical protein
VRQGEHNEHGQPPTLDNPSGERTVGTFQRGTTKQPEGEHHLAAKVEGAGAHAVPKPGIMKHA